MSDTPTKSARKQILPADPYKTPKKSKSRETRLKSVENITTTEDEEPEERTKSLRKSARKISPSKRYNETEFAVESPGKKQKRKPAKVVTDEENLYSSDSDGGRPREKAPKPKEVQLFEDELDVEGKRIYGFNTPKKRDGMALAAAATPKTPKTPRASAKTPDTKRNKFAVEPKTPRHVRNKVKNQIAKLLEDSSNSDFSAEESDFEPSAESSPSSSSDADDDSQPQDDEEEDEKPKRGRRPIIVPVLSKTLSASRSRRPTARNPTQEYVPESDGYFTTHSTNKIHTSDHTLDRLKNPRLPADKLFSLLASMTLSKEHEEAISSIMDEYKTYFSKWMYILNEGFNILLYGLGSKRNLLQRFHREVLAKQTVLVVNGFFPSLTIKDILDSIINEILDVGTSPGNPHEAVDIIEEEFGLIPETHLYLIVHNIDGTMLRNTKAQEILSRLAKVANIHLLASIDHINTPLLWDHTKLSNYNFSWWDVTTMLPYSDETAFENSLLVQNSGELALSSMRSVFSSLTTNARGIYMIIVKYQLKNKGNPNFQGTMIKVIVLACFVQAALASYNHYKLPESVRPEHYRLEIITHLENPDDLRFEGTSVITLNVLEEINNITLHSSNLTIDQPKITILQDGKQLNCIKDVEVNAKQEYYIMHLCEPLPKGKYTITLPFSAELSKNLHGYYRSSYLDKATKERRWLSITQFEPTSARFAFPCFDEPEMKANFTIVLGHEKKYSAISNTPLKETTEMNNQNGWVWSEFQESVPMSTYLVAYSVNDFQYKESMVKLKNDVRFRTWARKDAISQVEFAAEVGPRVLQYYEEMFDIKFPLPKIDEIAIPDFSSGAMENWGLVTYRETALLYEKNVSSASSKHRVASVISHELAHQWFGNLVTMKWWTDLWLNEGFATYVASLGVEYLHPEWSSLTEESVDNTLHIFKVDALKSSHPVSTTIADASEIFQIFDSISYEKGSCIIRMMHLFMGDETFRTGITNYLREHSYANAEQDDLWAALTQTAHKSKTIPAEYSIKKIMDSWTLQTGYPVITVTRDYDNGTASVTQTRYLLDTKTARSSYENCWWVPLSYTTKSELDFETKTPKEWLECEEKTPVPKVIENMPGQDEWVIFNIQLAALYRVKYDAKNWDMLIETLNGPEFERIHTMNRAQLIDDALDMAWTGDQDYDIAMRLVEYLAQERDYIPWKSALDNLAAVNKILRQTPEYEFFQKYMQKILEPIYQHLNGLNNTDVFSDRLDAIKHKVMIAGWACKFKVGDCVSRAQSYFAEWQNSENPDKNNPVPLDLRSVVYCTSIRHGKEEEWQFLWQRCMNSNVASEKQTILSALGCSHEKELLQRYLDWSFNESSGIRKQDSYTSFGSVARGEVGFPLARDYLINNINLIYDYYNPETNRLGRLLSPLAGQMNSESEFLTMTEFTDKNKALFAKASQAVRRSLEMIEINAQWRSRNFLGLTDRLKTYAKNG